MSVRERKSERRKRETKGERNKNKNKVIDFFSQNNNLQLYTTTIVVATNKVQFSDWKRIDVKLRWLQR